MRIMTMIIEEWLSQKRVHVKTVAKVTSDGSE